MDEDRYTDPMERYERSKQTLPWSGVVLSVQPRIRLFRSFDEVSHTYLGYNLGVDGEVEGEKRKFVVAIGKATHAKHQLRTGDKVSGVGKPLFGHLVEMADLFKVSKFKVVGRGQEGQDGPPWHTLAPSLEVYRERGHRRLDAKTFDAKCSTCVWGCQMPVEILVDHWKPDGARKYRVEAFCYGPTSCPSYAAGPKRQVKGRNGMVYVEEDWVDADAVSHRKPE